ncbi:hypothetical protein GRI43_06615 [Altererythrobacter luteolus]|uniref:Uncharacterized protein n=1 Tax=Pontixanthobacter luteolus TaxID=295089 RepID=A0A6I4V2I4_9SPHN|nr:hypothetical protein [Pontixanthobacter luteolus]MXP47060.1 hypothetical protein [Pontixanthobacter luteolus]
MRFTTSASIIALAICAPLSAQESAEGEPLPDASSGDEILVIADRLRGQVDTAQAPILELDEADIAAYGVSSIEDLLAAIEPQTGSSRGRGGGRPVFLVNGIRVGSFREFRSYPPEAIRKVEVLPEETAQKFGFPPDRRVINFLLKDDFSALTAEVEYEQPFDGGYSYNEKELTLLKITGGGRLNLNLEFSDRSLLTEAERGIIQTPGSIPDVPGDPDPAQYRSLIADSANIEATANWAKAFTDSGASLSANGTYERSSSRSLSGLNTVILTAPSGESAVRTLGADNPLVRRSQSDTFSSAASYSRPVGDFQLTATADASYVSSTAKIDRRADTSDLVAAAAAGTLAIDAALPALADPGFDIADTDTYSATSKLTLRGTPVLLPAGELSTTFDLGYDWDRIESEDSRAGSAIQLTRGNINGGINLAVPITSVRDDVLAAVGSVTLNGQAGFNHYSDFGTLYRLTGGVTWAPTDTLDLQATYVWREVPPSLSQLGSPQVETLNVPTFDFATGETSLVTVTSGGNQNLKAETQSDWNFSANWELPFIDGARLRAEYVDNRSSDVSSSFPYLTPDVEAAFPDRVTRDNTGQLIALDQRPVDFFETRTKRLTFGLTLRGSIGSGDRGGRPGSGGPPRASARDGAVRPDRAAEGPRGPVTEEQRERFMQFRERLCADDGDEFLKRVAQALAAGEAPADIPGFDPERLRQMIDRFRSEDGSIDEERLAAFRTRICDSDAFPRADATGDRNGQERAQGQQRSPRGGMPRGLPGRPQGTRYFLNLSHSIELEREILIAENGPLLDLLDGDSLTSSGNPRHSAQLEGGIFSNGYGMRLSARYTGSSRIDGTDGASSTNLFLDDLATLDLRLFADLGTVFKQDEGLLKGMRASFRIDNVFDGRQRVTDSNGQTPIGFQPLLIDPVGRYVGIDLRKLF